MILTQEQIKGLNPEQLAQYLASQQPIKKTLNPKEIQLDVTSLEDVEATDSFGVGGLDDDEIFDACSFWVTENKIGKHETANKTKMSFITVMCEKLPDRMFSLCVNALKGQCERANVQLFIGGYINPDLRLTRVLVPGKDPKKCYPEIVV